MRLLDRVETPLKKPSQIADFSWRTLSACRDLRACATLLGRVGFGLGFGLMAFTAAVFGQHSEGSLEREGKFWVEKLSGSERLTAHSRLRVHAPGNVTLQ